MTARLKSWYSFLLCILIISIGIILLHSCVTFRMSTNELETYLETKTSNGSHHYYTIKGRRMHYAQAGSEKNPLVVFVHGSPGSLSAFIDYLADSILTQNVLAVTVDRPGFGHSGFGYAEPSLINQASYLLPILEKYQHNRPIILVGHSLAGPVIARIAIDNPELVDGLILVGASVDPELEPHEMWFRAPLATPFLSWILPRSLRASNDEIYHLKPQLQAMEPLWKQIHCPVYIIQGGKDKLVPPGNMDFARRVLVNADVKLIYMDSANHFIPWNRPEMIHQAIMNMLQKPAVQLSEN